MLIFIVTFNLFTQQPSFTSSDFTITIDQSFSSISKTEDNILFQNRENQFRNLQVNDCADYFLPNIALSINELGIHLPHLDQDVISEIKNNIENIASYLVLDLLDNKDLSYNDFKPVIKEIADAILDRELTEDDLEIASKSFFERISQDIDHFIRNKRGETFYIWNTFGIKQDVIEEYFLLITYNSPQEIFQLTSTISQNEKLVNKEDIFEHPELNRNKRSVYDILKDGDATSEEISYIQAKALNMARYNTNLVSIPIMFDEKGTRKIMFSTYQDQKTNAWHALGNKAFLSLLPETDILINEYGCTINGFENSMDIGNALKNHYPSSGLIYILDSPDISLSGNHYYESRLYINSLLNNLKQQAENKETELIKLEDALKVVSESRLIEILNGIQLFPETITKIISKIIFSADEKKPGLFTFPIYNNIVWIQPRISFRTFGVIIDLFIGNLDLVSKYIRNPQELRKEIIAGFKDGDLTLAEKYFYIKETYFNGMEYGDLTTDWFYKSSDDKIFYVDQNGVKAPLE
ncbi:MAG: hypothetical protein P9M06_06125 [Candidatus Saelkia tenebricola]|nr:hypothetical protein [Candidatus Saelkia tenebricola]